MATLVREWTTSSPITASPPSDMAWDDAILAAFPAIAWTNNGVERIDPNLLSQLEDLFKTIAHTETLSRGPWNVDDLHVTNYYKPLIISTADRIDKNGLSKSKVNLSLCDL